MIIQIKCGTSGRWMNRCQCPKSYVKKEIAALERIYKHNEFRAIDGDEKLPGPIYHNKPRAHIDDIVAGIEWLERQPKDHRYPMKAAKVMQGKIKAADMKAIERMEKMQQSVKRSIRRRVDNRNIQPNK